MRIFKIFLVVLGLSLTACGAPETVPDTSPWTLMNTKSRVEFISVKKGTIVETHSFGTLEGKVTTDGKAVVTIVLDSVETNIDIRNQRMREYLFETKEHPFAIITAQLDKADFAFMNIGDRLRISLPMRMDLHGKNDILDIALTVTRLSDNKIMVESQTPIILDIDTFGLQDGIEKLRELAKLPSITPEVPVMFSLVFERG
jgi:YceI-like domain